MKATTILAAFHLVNRKLADPDSLTWPKYQCRIRQFWAFRVRLDRIADEYDAHQQRLADAKATIAQMRKERQ